MINMQLAKECNLSEEAIEKIQSIHNELESILLNVKGNDYDEATFNHIENKEFELQRLWGFEEDKDFHTWNHEYVMLSTYLGVTLRCEATGKSYTLECKDIKVGNHIRVGKCSLEFMGGAYTLRTGKLTITHEQENIGNADKRRM